MVGDVLQSDTYVTKIEELKVGSQQFTGFLVQLVKMENEKTLRTNTNVNNANGNLGEQ